MPTYHSASGSVAEDLFIELFSETFGAEKAGYLYSQYHFYDIYQNSRYADFMLENGAHRVAIEIDDETSHNKSLVASNKFYDDLLKQNSMVHLGWDVYRWAVRQMQIQPEAVKDELRVFLGSHPQFKEIEDYLPQQRGKALDGTSLELKEHQKAALNALRTMRANRETIALLYHATGTGKTVTAVMDARSCGGRVLFLAHTQELINQATETFRKLWPSVTVGRYMETMKQPNAHVVCGSIQSIALHLDQFKDNDFDYLIVDEAHHAAADTYQKVLAYFKPSFTLGLTATPERTDDNKVIIFMMKFIEQYKTTGYDDSGFAILRERTDNPRTLLFLDIAEQVYHHYQSVLKQRNQIDFADMINDAHFYLQEIERQNVMLPYKYIIIDEFQDIARQRFNLTKRLSQITQAKVVAVGDDWQSIYAFSGSDITLFTRFLELMGAGTELKITHTYRNSQELIDIAGGFVQRNTSQIRKQLISPKHLENPIVLEVFDDSIKPMERLADTIEHVIGEILSEYGEQSSILLIGRYNYDMYKLYRTNRFSELPGGAIRSEKYPNAKITFMTAHSSKGLGYDNVILINMFEGKFGFPCQIEDDPIIKLVTYEDNSMPFAEERRLFYVAMTRTKNRVYIAAPKTKPSRFLVELIKDFNIPHDDELNMQVVDLFNLRCPVCGFPLKYEFNKNYGLNLWICTNEAELCDFMTNDRTHMHDILKCPKCTDGYLIVKKNPKNGDIFYGCTNYFNEERKCTYMVPLESGSTNDQ